MTPVPESGIAAKATPPATSPSTIVTSTTERPRPRSGAYMKQPPLIEYDLVESLYIELRSIQSMAVGDRPPTKEGEGHALRDSRGRSLVRDRPRTADRRTERGPRYAEGTTQVSFAAAQL